MKLLLDTCSFLWLATGSGKLSKSAVEAYLDQENEVYLSAASAWEIALKHSLGRLELPSSPGILIKQMREESRIDALIIDEEAALHAGRLPHYHADPFDRMLVAQAIIYGMVILTPDEAIAQYPARVLW